MTLDEARTQLSAYLDGELAEGERRAVEAALAAHPELAAELAALRRTAELVRAMPRASAPAWLSERVQAAIASRAPSQPRHWLRGWRPVAIAAAACLLVAIAALLTQPKAPRPGARGLETPSSVSTEAAKPAAAETERVELRQPTDAPSEPAAESLNKADALRQAARDRDLHEQAQARRATAEGEALAAAPAQHPAKPRGAGGAGRAPAPTAPSRGPESDNFAAADDGRRGSGVGGRSDLKHAEEKKPAQATGAVATMKAAPAPPPAMLTEEAAKGDGDIAALSPGASLRKAGEAALQEAREAQQGRVGRRLADRDELLDAIEGERRLEAKVVLPEPSARPDMGYAANADLKSRGAKDAAAERTLDARLSYTDLARCLAEVQAALEASNLAYALQPIGGGEFVVEAVLPEPEAKALLARLSEPATDKARQKAEGAAATSLAAREASAERAREPGHRSRLNGTVKAQAGGGAPMVRLVIRFARADGPEAAPPAKPAARPK